MIEVNAGKVERAIEKAALCVEDEEYISGKICEG